jgi:hypothetical protein
MGDDRRSNVMGELYGPDASPAPETRDVAGREAELAARTLADRDPHNDPAELRGETSAEEEGDGDVDRRP